MDGGAVDEVGLTALELSRTPLFDALLSGAVMGETGCSPAAEVDLTAFERS